MKIETVIVRIVPHGKHKELPKEVKHMLLGFEMPSWFDLMTLDATGPEDEAGIKSASALVSFGFGLLPLSM